MELSSCNSHTKCGKVCRRREFQETKICRGKATLSSDSSPQYYLATIKSDSWRLQAWSRETERIRRNLSISIASRTTKSPKYTFLRIKTRQTRWGEGLDCTRKRKEKKEKEKERKSRPECNTGIVEELTSLKPEIQWHPLHLPRRRLTPGSPSPP